MAAAAPNSALKRSKYFTDKSEGYKFLANAFQEFDRTDGKAGIDPYLSKKEEIHAIYNKYSVFCDYSIKSTFQESQKTQHPNQTTKNTRETIPTSTLKNQKTLQLKTNRINR